MITFRSLASTVALTSALVVAGIANAQDYDLVISNGRVMDPETLYDGVANVGISDGRIVKSIKEPSTSAEEIDASIPPQGGN
ncbi:hypothetical protein M1105_20350 [Limibaculum sp. FT325]|uniref:hypothetical protein n=1 Tax=Thermohalobaculum sediminis TaxID=2939436 RepID=UPI0020BFE7B3|nr:hypothetical protein [Limibaculum sediminis]MCL5779303.1 hypothetical protein [Limibaculum sediminis]